MARVFISHKHSDRAIATVIRGFVTEQTANRVKVFQSSDSGDAAETPMVGRPLNPQLAEALWDANGVVLVYTTPDQDWGYCMWECGVATDPKSPHTGIFVLQCTDSVPSLFEGQVRINARNVISVKQFVTQFLTKPGFLPGVTEALTEYNSNAPEVERAATRLFESLKAVLPEWPNADWPTHPYVQVQTSNAALRRISDSPADGRIEVAREILLSDAIVSDSDATAHALFGLTAFDPAVKLQTLIERWRSAFPKASAIWIDGLLDQIARSAQSQFPGFRWSAMPAVDDGHLHAPVVTRARRIPALAAMQFDVYFYPFNLLDATPVESRMVRRSDMFSRIIGPGGESEVRVLQLAGELRAHGYSRIPFVTPDDRFVYIAHLSMLDQFLVEQLTPNAAEVGGLTLADLFSRQPKVRDMFAGTAAFVAGGATLGDAKIQMNATPKCYDVFVTENGKSDGPILGWITDVIVAESES
jgi:hypothetical protein